MQDHEPVHEDAEQVTVEPTAIEFTGQAAVDAVLESMETLAELPVADHVQVFDRAHEDLRRALNDAGREPAAGQD